MYFLIYREEEEQEEEEKTNSPHRERKFIVFESALMELFTTCKACAAKSSILKKRTVGTLLVVETICTICDFNYSWSSQPTENGMPLGNLIVSAGILFSGSSPVKALNMLRFSKIETFCLRTYYNIQSLFLLPTINRIWQLEQDTLFSGVIGPLKLGGDARCCSPGHTAKYGSYSLMNLENSKVLDMQLVQVCLSYDLQQFSIFMLHFLWINFTKTILSFLPL